MTSDQLSAKPQTTTIHIQIPTGENLAEKRFLIPISFGLVILLFFFNFCDFRIVGNTGQAEYPSNEKTEKSVTGFNFITGTALLTAGVNSEIVSGLPGIKNDQAENLQKLTFNIWAFLVLAAAVGGVYVFWKKLRNEALLSTALAVCGIIGLLLLLSSVKKYEGTIDAGFVTLQTKMIFQFGYWASLLCFMVAGVISYFRLKLRSDSGPASSAANSPTPIHVNIITQEADTAGKM